MMSKWTILLTLSLLCLVGRAHSDILEAHSIIECGPYANQAECKQAARNDALSSLSMQLLTQVHATSTLQQSSEGTDLFQWQSRTTSQLPILGAVLNCETKGKGRTLAFACQARMQANASAKKYHAQLQALKQKIEINAGTLESKLSKQDVTQFYQLLSDIQQFEKLSTVYLLLASQQPKPTLSVSAIDIAERVQKLETQPQNFAQLATILAKQVSGRNILIKPVLAAGSQEVTPFSSMLYQELLSAFSGRTSNQLNSARLVLTGSYQVQKQKMILAVSLNDKQGQTEFSRVWHIAESLYADYDTQPKLVDFDHLLSQGVVQDDEFTIQIQTNKGSKGVVFVEGERANLLVKLNRSGYFYLVGHTQNSKGKLSYLMELTNEAAPYSFERYVGPDEINRWLSLGEFEVMPDFGNESLQVFASDQSFRKTGRLPETQYDGTYYVVAKSTTSVLAKTRGLVKKKSAPGKSPIGVEAVLMFQTIAKR